MHTAHSRIYDYAGFTEPCEWLAVPIAHSPVLAYLIMQGCKEPCGWLAAPIAHNPILAYLIMQGC